MPLFHSNTRYFTEPSELERFFEDLPWDALPQDIHEEAREAFLVVFWRVLRFSLQHHGDLHDEEGLFAALRHTNIRKQYFPRFPGEALGEILAVLRIGAEHAGAIHMLMNHEHGIRPEEAIEFEHDLAEAGADKLLGGPSEWTEWQHELGFTRGEMQYLRALSRAFLERHYSRDANLARAEVLAKLDKVYKDAMDPRVKLMAIKTQATVEGLHLTPPQNDLDDAIRVTNEITSTQPLVADQDEDDSTDE